jgi:hypothetical protein
VSQPQRRGVHTADEFEAWKAGTLGGLAGLQPLWLQVRVDQA